MVAAATRDGNKHAVAACKRRQLASGGCKQLVATKRVAACKQLQQASSSSKQVVAANHQRQNASGGTMQVVIATMQL